MIEHTYPTVWADEPLADWEQRLLFGDRYDDEIRRQAVRAERVSSTVTILHRVSGQVTQR